MSHHVIQAKPGKTELGIWQQDKAHIHTFLTQGLRYKLAKPPKPASEDAGVIGTCSDFAKLPPLARMAVLRKTVAVLEQKCDEDKVGSTGCSAFAWIKDTTLFVDTFNVGDSMAFLVIQKANGIIELEQLTKPHDLDPDDPDTKAEYDRIYAIKNPSPFKKRGPYKDPKAAENGVNIYRFGPNGLMVGRSFGDREYERYGLIHTPDVCLRKRKLAPGDNAFVITATDGFLENTNNEFNRLHPQNRKHQLHSRVKTALQEIFKSNPENIAQTLYQKVSQAIGTSDDTAISFFKVTDLPTFATKFDGHGGDTVSKKLADNFHPVFEAQIRSEQNTKNFEMRIHQLSHQVTEEILECAFLSERVATMDKWIQKMHHADREGDFCLASAIWQGLNNDAVKALKTTHAALPNKSQKILQSFSELESDSTSVSQQDIKAQPQKNSNQDQNQLATAKTYEEFDQSYSGKVYNSYDGLPWYLSWVKPLIAIALPIISFFRIDPKISESHKPTVKVDTTIPTPMVGNLSGQPPMHASPTSALSSLSPTNGSAAGASVSNSKFDEKRPQP